MNHPYVVARPLIRGRLAAAGIVAATLALPWLVHLGGLPGSVLLPMHFAAVLTGLALGPTVGLLAGLVAPPVSFLLTRLPPAVMVPLMVPEVATYGAVAGWLAYRTAWRGVWVVVTALVAGRLAAFAAVTILGPAVGVTAPPATWVAAALRAGWPGVALQVLLLSPAARLLVPARRR